MIITIKIYKNIKFWKTIWWHVVKMGETHGYAKDGLKREEMFD